MISNPYTRKYLNTDVLTAARWRISQAFDQYEKVSVSFSGGKDSGVLLHLVAEEARLRKRRFTVLFIDWEAQYELTIGFVRQCLDLYADCTDPLWVCLPLTTVNACSVHEPEWTCWDPAKRDLWVREPPAGSIGQGDLFPFYKAGMTFEDFVVAYGSWFRGAIFVGLRATESYDRFLGTFSRLKMVERSQAIPESRVFCPLYDWRAEDIWTYNARFAKLYNPLYDRMHQAGISVHRMRVCEPYGNEQKQGLWLFHIIEPEMWSKVCARVAGANSGALYSGEKGNMTGTKLTLPPGHTWKSFTMFLLETMPKQASEHYKNKIAVYLKWYRDHDVPELPDSLPKDTGAKDVGTWRRICSTLLKHDYWAIRLGFAPNKTSAYAKYQELMKKRREQWAII